MTSSSASAERRKRLKVAETQNGHALQNVLDACPIEKYYHMADRLLTAFNLALDERRLDDAYVFGLRFATFSLEGLPKHSGYKSTRYKMHRLKNSRNVEDVLNKMASVTTRMDAEEMVLARRRRDAVEAKRRAELEREAAEERQKQDEATREKRHAEILQQQREELRALQQQEEQAKNNKNVKEQRHGVENSAMEKLRLMNLKTKNQKGAAAVGTSVPSIAPKEPVAKPTSSAAPKESSPVPQKSVAPTAVKSVPKVETTEKKNSLQKLSPKKKSTSKQQVLLEPRDPPAGPANATTNKPASSNLIKQETHLAESSKRKLLQLSSKKKPSNRQVTADKPAQQATAASPSTSLRSVASKQLPVVSVAAVSPKSKGTAPVAPATQSTSKRSLFQQLSPKKKQPSSKSDLKVSAYSNTTNSEGHEITTPSTRSIRVPEEDPVVAPEESPYKANLTTSEARTLKLLEDTIKLQEGRLEMMEKSKEPARLRQEAKMNLKNGDKPGALKCLAKKKRLYRMMDVTKHAIFNMETQMIMLESAVEQREISKIMKETNDVVSELQGGSTQPIEDICTEEKINDILATLNHGSTDMFDEEELLSELQEPGEGVVLVDFQDDNSLLALPDLPDNPLELQSDTAAKPKSLLASLF